MTDRPPRSLPSHVGALLGWLAVVAIAVPLAISVVPVDNAGVQHCGTPAAFLLGGRVDTYPDAHGQIRGAGGRAITLSKAAQDRAYHHQCSRRIAHRMAPLAFVLTGGLAVGLGVLVVSMVVWWRRSPPREPVHAALPAS